jgi:hypothetical protein
MRQLLLLFLQRVEKILEAVAVVGIGQRIELVGLAVLALSSFATQAHLLMLQA